MSELNDQVHIITGAGRGIGLEVARRVAQGGATAILVARTADQVESAAATLRDMGLRAEAFVADITDPERTGALVAHVRSTHGRIDGLVNNAGGQFPSPLESISDKGWDAVVRNNLNGSFSMMREVFTQWMRAHGGAIVGVVAPVDFGFPNMGHTGAARAGVINLTQTAALEWVQHGVRVNAVAPGSIIGSGLGTYSAEFQERLKTRRTHIPYHRLGTEAEVSACICFLLSPASTYVTGLVLQVDGGLRLAKHNWTVPEHQAIPPYDPFGQSARPEFLKGQ